MKQKKFTNRFGVNTPNTISQGDGLKINGKGQVGLEQYTRFTPSAKIAIEKLLYSQRVIFKFKVWAQILKQKKEKEARESKQEEATATEIEVNDQFYLINFIN